MGGMAVEVCHLPLCLPLGSLNRFFVIVVHLYEMEWQVIWEFPVFMSV